MAACLQQPPLYNGHRSKTPISPQQPPLYNGHLSTRASSLQQPPLYNSHLSTTAILPVVENTSFIRACFFCFHETDSRRYLHLHLHFPCLLSLMLLFERFQTFEALRRVQNLRGTAATKDDNTRNILSLEIRLTRTLFVTVLGYLICWKETVGKVKKIKDLKRFV